MIWTGFVALAFIGSSSLCFSDILRGLAFKAMVVKSLSRIGEIDIPVLGEALEYILPNCLFGATSFSRLA
jgi:hypothetical protein